MSGRSSSSQGEAVAPGPPCGARFYRCALQVNPFAYLGRHGRSCTFESEDDYNRAIVEACLANDIEVIAVTDHYRFGLSSKSLLRSAREAGLKGFGGFEAVTKDGVHFLCLVDPYQEENLERFIGACGIRDEGKASPLGRLDSEELLREARKWGAASVAAHVAGKGGLLQKLEGQTRINVWTSPDLLACALPGPAENVREEGIRQILLNKDAQHRRQRPVAIVNASDVYSPEDLAKKSSSCYIKMSEVSVEALRQAFLDPESRIRLHSDPSPAPHAEFLEISWEGGFLRDMRLCLNDGLNALVGGRGAGKSTVIESLRYVLALECLGEEAQEAHEGFVKHVLGAGTKVSLRVRSHHPSEAEYVIERTAPNPPIVKDAAGEVLAVRPQDVMPGVQVFGQHEISELVRRPEKLTALLERFAPGEPSSDARKAEVRLALEQSRSRIVETRREMENLEGRLEDLPGLEERQERFREAGLEERLKERSLLVKEEAVFGILDERLDFFRGLQRKLADGLPIDAAFVADRELDGLPNAEVLGELAEVLAALSNRLADVGTNLETALVEADAAITGTKGRWQERRKEIEEKYEALLRDLQSSAVDGAEFIELRQRIEGLRPLKDRRKRLEENLKEHESHRLALLSEWEDIKAHEYRQVADAAKRISGKLKDRVRVKATMAEDRGPLESLLGEEVGGNLTAALRRLAEAEQFSLTKFAQCCKEGRESLEETYDLPSGSAGRIADAGPDLHLKVEELELPAGTHLELNTSPDGQPPEWRSVNALSSGQKATAVLLLLLLESEAPLVVDQPEDDLDNRFITEGVVPIVRYEKRQRQFVFSTHNANIPVLGDAELILGLVASGEAGDGHAEIPAGNAGSIDTPSVRELLAETLEGGKDAFDLRRSKYGF